MNIDVGIAHVHVRFKVYVNVTVHDRFNVRANVSVSVDVHSRPSLCPCACQVVLFMYEICFTSFKGHLSGHEHLHRHGHRHRNGQ
jgi:hypothetical protein